MKPLVIYQTVSHLFSNPYNVGQTLSVLKDKHKQMINRLSKLGFILLMLMALTLNGQNRHTSWNNQLAEFVTDNGDVNYEAWKKEIQALDSYLNQLSNSSVESFDKAEAMAFWINAYNAFTIKLILDHYPLESIMELDNGKIWDRKWISMGSQILSLNDIEHEILRKEYPDPRIHFAVNCAAKSCPPLHNLAFTAKQLEKMLEERTALFINDSSYNQFTKKAIYLSQIFNWYRGDFPENLQAYLLRYLKSPTSNKLPNEILYNEYDWNLNKQ